MTTPPTIALVLNAPYRLLDITIRFEPYVEGFRELGVDVITVCPSGTDQGYPYSVRTFADDCELTNPQFWRDLGCRAVAIITWHRMTEILMAIREAGVHVLNIAESDGQVGVQFHPWATFQFMTFLQPTMWGKLKAAKYWLQRFLFRASAENQAIIENLNASDVLLLAGEGGVREFRKFLHRFGEPELMDRLAWLPYPVSPIFCTAPVTLKRANRLIAIGRWDSPQKNSGLLSATIRRLAAAESATEIWIVGKNSQEKFGELARTMPHIRVFGIQPRNQILELMTAARSILITSRWESGPIIASEMLALGGTVIGTPIPNLREITADGRFGRVSHAHTSNSLAAAVNDEMAAWESGDRDSLAIADYWRPLVSPVGVARRMLSLLDSHTTYEHPSIQRLT